MWSACQYMKCGIFIGWNDIQKLKSNELSLHKLTQLNCWVNLNNNPLSENTDNIYSVKYKYIVYLYIQWYVLYLAKEIL
jgi:hypothetical protein